MGSRVAPTAITLLKDQPWGSPYCNGRTMGTCWGSSYRNCRAMGATLEQPLP